MLSATIAYFKKWTMEANPSHIAIGLCWSALLKSRCASAVTTRLQMNYKGVHE